MANCEKYRQQLALLSANALERPTKAGVLAHVQECGECRAYWEQLQALAQLLTADAGRPVQPLQSSRSIRIEQRSPVLTFPRAVAFGMAIVILCAIPLLLHKSVAPPKETTVTVTRSNPVHVPTIADSRRLINKLEALTDPAHTHSEPDFVFSVGTRYEGPQEVP